MCSFPFAYFGSLQLVGQELGFFGFLMILVVCAVPAVITIRQLVNTFHSIKKVRLAYECELAVGQELEQLMLQGFYVFHDIQAGKFNIDHVVVGKTGIFAVETKGRSKRANSRGEGKEEFKVNYQDGVLHFPGWQEVEPLKQAETQAKWLADDLSKSTGIRLNVSGVVVLPGWFINMPKPQRVPVFGSGRQSVV